MNKRILPNGLYEGELVVTRFDIHAWRREINTETSFNLKKNELLLIRDHYNSPLYRSTWEWYENHLRRMVFFTVVRDQCEGHFYMPNDSSSAVYYVARIEERYNKI